MLAVVIGLLLIVTIAAGIVAVVAAPRLREGEDLLTPEGKQTILRAGQQAKEQSAAAAVKTVQHASSLRGKVSSAWAPMSDVLHQQFDRLENGPEGTSPGGGHPIPSGEPAAPAPAEPESGSDPAAIGGPAAAVGRPRPIPADSGPIPEIEEPEAARPRRNHGPQAPTVINLRDAEGEALSHASPDVTTRRRS